MLFNSVEFLIFLPIVFFSYWAVGSQKLNWQNLLLILASYVFYAWWSPKFLILIVVSSLVDYFVGKKIHLEQNNAVRKSLLILSIVVNLGILGFFKYFNFFIGNLKDIFLLFGLSSNFGSLEIILPVGISFYTFQTMSYTIDIYRKNLVPAKNWTSFFIYVSYFPQLVAGPIERATNLLPQFEEKRIFDYDNAKDGVRQVLWGFFKKVVIADTAAIYANDVFNNFQAMSSASLVLGVFYFSFQIYGDFSGYSDIAIGISKLFGIRLMVNFRTPYFSRDIGEFWRRWHISLSTWFRDYVYIPLGGNKGSAPIKIRNVFCIFVLSGLWHGANWTFIFWGALNACYFIPLLLCGKNRQFLEIKSSGGIFPSLKEISLMCVTFSFVGFSWILFRSKTIGDSLTYIQKILFFDWKLFPFVQLKYLPFIALLVAWEWLTRDREHGLDIDGIPQVFRWGIYYGLVILILRFAYVQQTFIYFQF